MTPATILTPFREGTGERTGPRTFRKQLLPVDKPIAYKGKTLAFSRAYLDQIAANFNAGAYDQVPAVLANEDNQHNEDPERFRGEVKSVEVTDRGLDVVVEMTEKGADLIAENPRLGVSARLVPEVAHGDGKTFENVLRHVCLTMDPRANGLHAWETVSLSSVLWPSQDGDRGAVIDLSAAEYMDTKTLTDEHLETLKGLEGDARAAKARELLGEMKVETTETKVTPDPAEPKLKDKLKGILGIGKDEEEDFDTAVEALLKEETETEKTGDKELVASLSADDRKVIDLAREEARSARRETAEATWKLERKELADAGVPPALLDLAEPILKTGQKAVIDLSNSEQADAAEVIRNLLGAAKGTVDLAKESGSGADSDEEKEAKEMASDDKWEASI